MIEIVDLHASYGKFEVLKGVSLEVSQGECVCMIGPNGAGKSTVFRTIIGFLKPLQGDITFEGESIAGLLPKKIVAKGISYVMQGDSIFPHMTILENLELGAYIRNDKYAVKKDLKMVQELFPILSERKHEMARNLSGGQRQMLEMGRGIMSSPRLLLLDEPTLGLAPIFQKLVFKKLLELGERRITVILVEQNARQALMYSDRAYVLENGQTILEGSGEDILKNPRVIEAYLGGRRQDKYWLDRN